MCSCCSCSWNEVWLGMLSHPVESLIVWIRTINPAVNPSQDIAGIMRQLLAYMITYNHRVIEIYGSIGSTDFKSASGPALISWFFPNQSFCPSPEENIFYFVWNDVRRQNYGFWILWTNLCIAVWTVVEFRDTGVRWCYTISKRTRLYS